MDNGLCADGAVYRQEVGLVLQGSTYVALTERAPEACFRKTFQPKSHQVRSTRTSRPIGVCHGLLSLLISVSIMLLGVNIPLGLEARAPMWLAICKLLVFTDY